MLSPIWTSAEAMTVFYPSLDFGPKFKHLRTLWPFFAHHVILGHHWLKGLNEIFAPGPEISLGAPATVALQFEMQTEVETKQILSNSSKKRWN